LVSAGLGQRLDSACFEECCDSNYRRCSNYP